MAITAHVVFSGTDYSGRPGNYFAHALVTSTPQRDFGSLLPAELWGAALWRTRPGRRHRAAGTAGPAAVRHRSTGQVPRRFSTRAAAADVLPELLTAVGRAMAGDRPVLLVSRRRRPRTPGGSPPSPTCSASVWPDRMTFTTYSHRPGYSRYHLIGTLPDACRRTRHVGFQMFDFDHRAGAGR